MSRILVGVDGSDHSRQALSWAMHEAAYHNVLLTVMAVHQGPVPSATQVYWNVPNLPDRSFDAERVRAAIQEMVDTVAKEIGERPPEVFINVISGDPAEELVNASRDADLLVVGSRGSGVFAQLLMGSVSSKVMHHAACPVVVVRGTG